MLINHLIHHVATFKPGQSLCWEVSTPFVSPIRNAGCICIFCMLLLPTSPGYKFHSTVAFTLCHSRSYHQRRCFGTWGLVMSEQWLVNVIWCDLQKFLPRRYSSWKNYGKLMWDARAVLSMFGFKLSSNEALSYFDLFNSLWNWASLWFSLFPNHIKPEIKSMHSSEAPTSETWPRLSRK